MSAPCLQNEHNFVPCECCGGHITCSKCGMCFDVFYKKILDGIFANCRSSTNSSEILKDITMLHNDKLKGNSWSLFKEKFKDENEVPEAVTVKKEVPEGDDTQSRLEYYKLAVKLFGKDV